MKPLRQLGAAIFLTLTLTISAWAGVMETGSPVPPPPPPPETVVVDPVTPNGEVDEGSLLEIELSILQWLLSVL
jgi:hypothetical protein